MISLKLASMIILIIVALINAYFAGGNVAHYSIIGNKHNLTVAIFNIIAAIACLSVMFLIIL